MTKALSVEQLKAMGPVYKRDGNGKPKPKEPHNLGVALTNLGVSLRYDLFADKVHVAGLTSGTLWNDATARELRFTINDREKFLPDKDLLWEFCLRQAEANAFDPVVDYFAAVQPFWDGTERISRFLVDYGGADDSPLVRAVSRLIFVAVVRRNRQPGAKFDEMPVLESAQGLNKSSALESLLIDPDWFTDSVPLNADDRKTIEHLAGKVIVEVAELQGMKKADVEHVKALLSRKVDRGRKAYARAQSEAARRFIFVGTSNSSTYLIDHTGNRRFWPISVKAFDLEAIRIDRDQLWAEAATAEANGESIRLDPSLWNAAGVEQDKRLAITEDPFTDALAHHLNGMVGRITSEAVWALLGFPDAKGRTPEHNRRMGAAMRSIGWKRNTIKLERGRGGARVAGYAKGDATRRIVAGLDFDKRPFCHYESGVRDPETIADPEADTEPDFG